LGVGGKHYLFNMQAQDATQVYLIKLWSWIEANKNRVIAVVAVIAVVVFVYWYFSWQRQQKETSAGQELAQLATSPGGQSADAYLKIAGANPDTAAGQRALLQGATVLFGAGRYTEAQAQFQKYLDQYHSSEFVGQASLGVAACLEAQGKTDSAASSYLNVIRNSSDTTAVDAAKFALARIDESAGKLSEAATYYEDVARGGPNSSLGNEAALRLMELRSKMPPPAPAKPAAQAAPVSPTPTPAPAAPATSPSPAK
jgi:predicted negative regulator of RcsB-dependent stress response